MKKKTHYLLTIVAASLIVAFASAPYVAHANTVVCAPDDTMTGCTCNANGYSPEDLAGAANINQPPPGIVQPSDSIVSSSDSTTPDGDE